MEVTIDCGPATPPPEKFKKVFSKIPRKTIDGIWSLLPRDLYVIEQWKIYGIQQIGIEKLYYTEKQYFMHLLGFDFSD